MPEGAENGQRAAGDGKPAFRRILLKLSGEALMGPLPYGVDAERIHSIARTVKRVAERGVEVAIVVGGGNIYRGLEGTARGMDDSSRSRRAGTLIRAVYTSKLISCGWSTGNQSSIQPRDSRKGRSG